MTVVRVDIAGAPYDVLVEAGALARAGELLAPYARGGRMLCVTDARVASHWAAALTDALAAGGIAVETLQIAPGEGSKDWQTLALVIDWLVARGVERSDHVIALGGGVVGDLTGFACSIVKRGCGFVQIPTSLLAQVDSSVGGKTAINVPAGKNLVGSFHQPAFVLIDPEMLATLPPRELSAGWAEVVKYGVIDDLEFFDWCETNREAFFRGDAAVREAAIARAVSAKARIVAADEKELTGTRALLNLGHTFGHSLEAETGFSDLLLHGEGVAAGMALALRYSARRGECPVDDSQRLSALLTASALPATLKAANVDAPGERLVGHMLHDKKMAGGNLPFLLARGIGATYLAKDVNLADVAAFLDTERAL